MTEQKLTPQVQFAIKHEADKPISAVITARPEDGDAVKALILRLDADAGKSLEEGEDEDEDCILFGVTTPAEHLAELAAAPGVVFIETRSEHTVNAACGGRLPTLNLAALEWIHGKAPFKAQ
ncbi:MAG TPA: hypothetical protein V6D17_20140 [Candidatus Obscuribacterales bacterium]